MKAVIHGLVCLLLLLSAAGWAQPGDSQLEEDAKWLESMLITPCCWRQTLQDHQSPKGREMKEELRARLKSGKTREEVLAYYVEQYGERILSVPPQQGFNRLAFIMPVVFLVVGLGVILLIIHSWRRTTTSAVAAAAGGDAPGARTDDEARARIERELEQG
jgi:cytochrome c-type biogenesis protein CcmH